VHHSRGAVEKIGVAAGGLLVGIHVLALVLIIRMRRSPCKN
jgi:hypothetical protein